MDHYRYLLALAVALSRREGSPTVRPPRGVPHRGAGFGVVSLLIASASDIGVLIALRAGQGVCAAMLQPAALALLRVAFPPHRLELALASGVARPPRRSRPGRSSPGCWSLGRVAAVFWSTFPSRRSPWCSHWPGSPNPAHTAPAGGPWSCADTGVAIGAVLTALSYFSLFGLLFFLTCTCRMSAASTRSRPGVVLPVTVVVW